MADSEKLGVEDTMKCIAILLALAIVSVGAEDVTGTVIGIDLGTTYR